MTGNNRMRIALLYPGDKEDRREVNRDATPINSRFAPLFQALTGLGAQPELAVYHDEFHEELLAQLMQVDAVLVWVNPITDGRDRTILDALLRKVTAAGVFVSTHPDIILKIGTKEVLYQTREMSWGSDTQRYATIDELREIMPKLLAKGEARVLKQQRGQSGSGVWQIELLQQETNQLPQSHSLVRVRHAQRGSIIEEIRLDEFYIRCEEYLAGGGKLIDQPYQPRLDEGMFRCYLVHDQVAGFGHQAINALYPAPAGLTPSEAPQPGPRLYYSPTMPEAQLLKQKMEEEWLPTLQQLLKIETTSLPVLWDADFLLGPKTTSGEDTYVLCEINVSSVSPFPDSAVPMVAQASLERAKEARNLRHTR